MSRNFDEELSRLRRSLMRGRLAATGLSAFAGAGTAWFVFGALDARFAFEPGARVAGTAALGALFAAGTGYAAWRATRLTRADAARRVDALVSDKRAKAAGALDLRADTGTPLARWLAGRSLEEAAEGLARVPDKAMFPKRTLRHAAVALGVTGVFYAVFALFEPEAFRTVGARLLLPGADLTPWSPLRFKVQPGTPSVLYGGVLDISVSIEGGEVESAECLVRDVATGARLRLPAFRESGGRFTRRVENVTGPVEVAFACGNARSAWVPVEVLYHPVVLSGKVLVSPPAYMGVKASESVLDATEIRVPEGAQVTLALTGNRPLAAGEAAFSRFAAPGAKVAPEVFSGKATGGREASYTWTARVSGNLSITLEDVRGTRAPKPLRLAVRVIPDAPPEVELSEPPALLVATPKTVVPLKGSVKDDYGVASVRLVRALSGFRDRPTPVAESVGSRAYGFGDSLDLGKLGATAGQTIEVMLEATDHNPSLMGRGGSELSRIVIVSESDYAGWLRSQATLEQFAPRFEALDKALAESREALENLEKAAKSGDPEATKAAREKALSAQRRAAETLEKLAADFPAFEMEKRLSEIAGKNAKTLRENIAALERTPAGKPDEVARVAKESAGRLGANREETEQLSGDAKRVAEAGKILEMAARFKELHEQQKSVRDRLLTAAKQVAKGDPEGARSLAPLGETQRKIREDLDAFAEELIRRRREMPAYGELDTMREDVGAFLVALKEADPGSAMDAAHTAATNADSTTAFNRAELALSLMEGLMKKKGNGFCQACENSAPRFEVKFPDVNETLAQMLSALCKNPGSGDGPPGEGVSGAAPGWGFGGMSPSGYAKGGIPLNVPVMGPKRSTFSMPSRAGAAHGKGEGGPGRVLKEVAEDSHMKAAGDHDALSRPPPAENVPETYRDAVKRYFAP